jgi:hypothetical protein
MPPWNEWWLKKIYGVRSDVMNDYNCKEYDCEIFDVNGQVSKIWWHEGKI